MTRERLIWAFDCDDVLVPTAGPLIEAYNQRYGTQLDLSAMYSDNDPSVWGTTSSQEAINRVAILLREGVTATIGPSRKMIRALTRLVELGDELHMVTGRQAYLEQGTQAMVDYYLPGKFTSLEFTNYYPEEGSGLITRTKGEVCATIGADILVDDHILHGSSVLQHGVKEVIVWGDFPWNRHQTLEQGMVRCTKIKELFRERDRILASR